MIPVTADAALLVADQLVAGYLPEVNILNGCSLELHEGELVGIVGPNGAGKSTLVKAIFGLVAIRQGRVTLRGEDISGMAAHDLVSRGMGYVPQLANVFPSLTVQENLEIGAYPNPRLWDQRFTFVSDLFPVLSGRRRQRAGSLSGGERKMLAIGRALMIDPDVLFLDEPSAGLSPANQDEVFARISDIKTAGISVVMVEQNARRCLENCDRAYVLDQGRNAFTGAGTDLLHDPRVVELYLGSLARVH